MPPVSNSPTMEFDQLMIEAKDLIARKDKIEEELKELEDVINTSGVTMDESMIDAQGFPRADIDVHSIRTSRNLIIRLRNDHRDVMKDIENVLFKIHEMKKQQQTTETTTTTTTTATQTSPTTTNTSLVAFAVVNAVAPDSPAYTAGLRRNDHILKFGHVHSENHNRLQALNALVGASENQQVPVTVLRDGSKEELIVTPRNGWGGRGTLGCHILPL